MIKYLIMDVDGTLTDGKIYMGPSGEAMKAFSIKDGYVFNYILKPLNIIPVIITARSSPIVQKRCDELGILEVYQGKMDKLGTLKEVVGDHFLRNCAYFGDDIIDIECMKPIKEAGGVIACPADAVPEVKSISDYICLSKAGEGALREFAEWLVSNRKDDEIICKRVKCVIEYLKKLNISESDVGKKIEVNKDFYYFVQSYVTKPKYQCKLESHRRCIDIQLMISGSEIIELTDISRLSVKERYDEEKDVVFWKIPNRMNRITFSPGDYIVLYPEMAHCSVQKVPEKSERVLKIVGKIRI